jgi:hypothetical protein
MCDDVTGSMWFTEREVVEVSNFKKQETGSNASDKVRVTARGFKIVTYRGRYLLLARWSRLARVLELSLSLKSSDNRRIHYSEVL